MENEQVIEQHKLSNSKAQQEITDNEGEITPDDQEAEETEGEEEAPIPWGKAAAAGITAILFLLLVLWIAKKIAWG